MADIYLSVSENTEGSFKNDSQLLSMIPICIYSANSNTKITGSLEVKAHAPPTQKEVASRWEWH